MPTYPMASAVAMRAARATIRPSRRNGETCGSARGDRPPAAVAPSVAGVADSGGSATGTGPAAIRQLSAGSEATVACRDTGLSSGLAPYPEAGEAGTIGLGGGSVTGGCRAGCPPLAAISAGGATGKGTSGSRKPGRSANADTAFPCGVEACAASAAGAPATRAAAASAADAASNPTAGVDAATASAEPSGWATPLSAGGISIRHRAPR